jgi:hypothetical protein
MPRGRTLGKRDGGIFFGLSRLGDNVEKVLNTVGVTHKRVVEWIGDCNCEDRKDRLNAFGAWVSRLFSRHKEGNIPEDERGKAREYLERIMDEDGTDESREMIEVDERSNVFRVDTSSRLGEDHADDSNNRESTDRTQSTSEHLTPESSSVS